ncbi:MAG: branched-chain amino acid ABC transporter permease [Pigmentiphaga sp.]|uniref:branched-chain amino acid ABC transporter permease n=1 Tax=Pigmentiphaga sp. TaxID=1977564 RepID=UPI0029B09710|nr:branched-chain amino acid ABC transporter permease [Pigmentiphaga sp.]MDX3905901.1 branched-chain amino acid ABC transporter permease [Pigmentiphaga sp.]
MNSRLPLAAPRGREPFGKSWHAGELGLWVLVVAVWFLMPDRLGLGTQVLIAALFALSLDLAMGYAGIVTLGHAAYLGLGAYVAGWLGKYGWTEPISAALLALAAGALMGLMTTRVVAAGTHLAGLMVTLCLGLLLYEAANKGTEYTGGVDGMQGITVDPVLGLFRFDFASRTAYIYVAVWLLLSLLLVRRMVGSPYGLTLRGVRQNPRRTASLGVDNRRAITIAYTVSAGLAGLAGALMTQSTQYVALDVLAFHRSADIVTMLVIGGAGYLYGGVLGAALFIILQDTLSGINPVYWQFWLGLALVLVMLFMPDGLMGAADRLRGWLRTRKTRAMPVVQRKSDA